MVRESGVQSQVESYKRLKKWYLILPCLTLGILRYVSRVKWSNSGKGVALSSTPRCSSYGKGSLPVALDYSRQLFFIATDSFTISMGCVYIYIYPNRHTCHQKIASSSTSISVYQAKFLIRSNIIDVAAKCTETMKNENIFIYHYSS